MSQVICAWPVLTIHTLYIFSPSHSTAWTTLWMSTVLPVRPPVPPMVPLPIYRLFCSLYTAVPSPTAHTWRWWRWWCGIMQLQAACTIITNIQALARYRQLIYQIKYAHIIKRNKCKVQRIHWTLEQWILNYTQLAS